MNNFLIKIETPLVVFTDKTLVDKIKNLRKDLPTLFIVYDLWNLPPIEDLKEEFYGR
jgi:hypothetical protein